MKVFLDTNVILDVLAGRQPFFADSQRVMTFCERNSGTGMASILTFLHGCVCSPQITWQRSDGGHVAQSAQVCSSSADGWSDRGLGDCFWLL